MNKSIRHITLLCAILLSTTASAWTVIGHEATAIIAERNISPKAKGEVERILGCTMKEAVTRLSQDNRYEAGTTTVTAALRSTTKECSDNVVRFEEAVALLSKHKKHSTEECREALQQLIYLTAELHNPGAVVIEGGPTDFNFCYNNGRFPDSKFLKITKSTWRKFWNTEFFRRHLGASPEMYAYDSSIFSRGRESEFSFGTPRDWVEQTAADSAPIRQHFSTTKEVHRTYINNIEEHFDRNLARAGLRLAATLNTLFDK